MIEMKTFTAPTQQSNLLLTMADLRKKRIELNMSSKTAAQYLGVTYGMICQYERENSAPQYFFELYRDYINGCANGTIYYKKTNSRFIHLGLSSRTKNIFGIRAIRKALKITATIASRQIFMSKQHLLKKELGNIYHFTQSEYDTLMKFYRTEKLKRIFVTNYKEGMMS